MTEHDPVARQSAREESDMGTTSHRRPVRRKPIARGMRSLVACLLSVGLVSCTPPPDDLPSNGGADDADQEPVFSFMSGDGLLQLKIDERLRPIEVVGPEVCAQIAWSDDSTIASVAIEGDGQAFTVQEHADFSDEATLEAIADIEEEIGVELTELRTWITENPGRTLATARGEEDAAQPPDDIKVAVISKPHHQLQSNIDPNVRRHLDMIADASAKAINTAFVFFSALRNAEATGQQALVPMLTALVNHFVDLRNSLLEYQREQQDACVACLPACLVRCGLLETGACCYLEGGETRCEDNITQDDCNARNDGIFHSGLACTVGVTDVCLSACCITTEAPGVGLISCCEDLYPETCDQIEINGTNVTTVHDRNRRCGDPEFFCPICD